MPIEREFKHILDRKHLTEKQLFDSIAEGRFTREVIEQGYFTKSGRLRRKTITHRDGVKLATPDIERIFTFKKDLKNRPGVLELEQFVSEEDFEMGWDETIERLVKVRYVIFYDDQHKWEVDFFTTEPYTILVDGPNEKVYLVMAECEVYGCDKPVSYPAVIQSYNIFSVPEDDKRFVNRKLSEIKYVERLLKEITSEKSKST